ncbi:MAG TPA: hypothetical protein VIT90_14825 [Lysobacter sp.]
MKVLDSAERVEVLRVIGSTDRTGSDECKRAKSMKADLVSKTVPIDTIHTGGRGRAEPVVTCDDRNPRALIACLSPTAA